MSRHILGHVHVRSRGFLSCPSLGRLTSHLEIIRAGEKLHKVDDLKSELGKLCLNSVFTTYLYFWTPPTQNISSVSQFLHCTIGTISFIWSHKGHMVVKTKNSAQDLMFHEPSGARTLWARSVLYFWFAKQHFGLQNCPCMLEIWAWSLPRWSRELRKYLYGCQSQQLAELHTEFLKSGSNDTGKRLGTRLLITSFASIRSCEQPLVLVPPT